MAHEHSEVSVADLQALAREETNRQPVWAHRSEDLNVNLLVFTNGNGVAPHTNDEVDVLLVGVAGTGSVEIDNTTHTLNAGTALIIPKGTQRAIQATSERFAYLACHRRRAGLWPRPLQRG